MALGGALLASGSQALDFNNSESAGNASIDNENDTVTFNDQSDAGTATIDNDTGTVIFNDQSTAASASIVNIDNATTEFYDQSSAGSATLTNELDGSTEFYGSSSASDATILTKDGGSTEFNGNSTAGNARLIANDSGFVDFSGSTGPNGDNRLSVGSVEGSGNFFLGSVQLSVGSNNLSTEMSGQFSDGTDASLTKVGTGTLTLSGDSSGIFNAAISIEGGLINFNSADSFGDGSITLNGGGLQWATGTTTDISNRLSPLGSAGGVFDTNGNDVTLASALSGSGALTKTGSGILLLNAVNSYSGGTLLQAGTLRQGVAGGLVGGSAYTVHGGTLDLNGFDLSMSSLAGSGGGAVALGSAQLTLNQAGDSSYAGSISGTGSFVKTGTGTFTLSGTSTYSGATTINQGTLVVNGSIVSDVTVNGGTLGGTGTLGALTVNSGGTVAPGNSIGTLSTANITFNAGSTYVVELNDGGNAPGVNNDFINDTGTATINGGTIHVTPENGTDTGVTYADGTTYTILTAAGGVTGAFSTLTDDYFFLDFTQSTDASNIFLTSALVNACPSGPTVSQDATCGGVLSVDSGSLRTAVITLSNAEAPIALDLLSGEIHASAKTALLEDSRFAREAALDRLRTALGGVGAGSARQEQESPEGATLWGRGFGSWGHWNGDGNTAGMDRNIGGLILGADGEVVDNVHLGALAGYSRSWLGVGDRASSGTVDTYSLGAYAGGQWAAFSLKGGVAHSWHGLDTSRSVAFTGFSDGLAASYDGRTLQAYGEAAYSIEQGNARFEPFANLAFVNLSTDGYSETGGAAALTASGSSSNATFTTLGIRGETNVDLGGVDATLSGSVGWRHAFGDTPSTTHSFSGGDVFTVAGVPLARDTLRLDAGLDVDLSENATVGLSYNGQLGGGLSDHGAKLSLNVGL